LILFATTWGGDAVTSDTARATRLAKRLRDLREHAWGDVNLTQAQLAHALSVERQVAPATLSSWESVSNPKTPTTTRLRAYARFFATRRSVDGDLRLIPLAELTTEERERFDELEEELLGLHAAAIAEDEPPGESRRALLSFNPDSGPIVVICPEAPEESRGPLADAGGLNYTRLHGYADIDALIEVFGHIRALNPAAHVLYRVPSTVQAHELQNHVVILGGIGWNPTVRRILAQLQRLPIEQYESPEFSEGELFRLRKEEGREERIFKPVMDERAPGEGGSREGQKELLEDVALLARLPNPFNVSRTLTICNGVYSRGVLGAVLTVTDETVRPTNEEYLAQRYPRGDFAMLLRVPVLGDRVLAPDLLGPDTRLFEWTPDDETPA
jgi:transcriptional regulator with XRE-family HTH domain